ncbi:MAG: PKD domain-containing protein, partial [Bacteroidota bacterium]
EGDVADCGTLPSPWTSADIGNVGAEGEACFDDGTFEIKASGVDIWGAADEFHYVYQALEGDGEIVARVVSLEQTDIWAKAGVMMRDNLSPDAALAQMIVAPNPNNVGGEAHSFQYRSENGAAMGGSSFTQPTLLPGGLPHYVRLVREGDTFTGYVSQTNGDWTQVDSQTIPMANTIFVGLATTSHDDGQLTTAVYDDVSLTVTNNNQPPIAVVLSDVTSGIAPLTVNFTGSSSTDDSNITSYEWDFKDGNTSTIANPSNTFTKAGTYEVELKVTDDGNFSDTAMVTITVSEPNTEGVVSFTLIDGVTDTDLSELTNDQQLDFGPIGGQSLNIRADVQPSVVGSVYFELTGPLSTTQTENFTPYALFGDIGGNYSENALPLGDYTLTATAYNGSGGSGGILGQPYVITFSVVDQAEANQSPLSISPEPVNNKVSLYPNPASTEITTTFEAALKIQSVLIFDITGRLVKTQKFDGQAEQKKYLIDVYDLPTGSYFMKMIDSGGNQFQKKIVIQK